MMLSHHGRERRVTEQPEERQDTAPRHPNRRRLAVLAFLAGSLLAASPVGLPGAPDDPVAVGKVAGRVVRAADGQPVGEAVVRLIRRGESSGPPPTRRATTNAQGEFTFDGVAAGSYRVLCFHDNLASRQRRYQGDTVTVAADGSSAPVVLKLTPALSVRVKVLSESDGQPIAGARVRLIWTDTDRDHLTDARGEVELRGLTPETWNLETSAPDRAAVESVLNLANGQPAALEVKLPPGGSLSGTVVDGDGRPLPGVGINVYLGDHQHVLPDYVKTDAEGRYRFDHLPLGQKLRLLFAKHEYVAEWKDSRVELEGQRQARLDVVVKKRPHGGSVRGVVTDLRGKPVAGAEVINRGGSSADVRQARTDAEGKFLLDNVYANTFGHELAVRAQGFAPQRVEFRPGPADHPAEVTVRLEPGHRIRGRVVNEAGRPVPGVRVYFAHGNRHPGMDLGGSTTTDAQGRFALDSLPEAAPFSFMAKGYSEADDQALPLDGEQEVVVTLKASGVITGRVVDAATGKPVPHFNVRITFSPDRQPDDPKTTLLSSRLEPGEEFVSPEGQFRLTDLLAGMPLQVTVNANGYRRLSLRRVVARPASAAEEVQVRLVAEDPAKLVTVRGRLVNHRGDPVRGAELRLVVARDRPARRDDYPFNWQMVESGQIEQADSVLQVQRRSTTADGRFEFTRVPGDAEIELVYWGKGVPGGRADHLEALSEKERTDLVVKVPAPASILGTVDRLVFPEFSSIQLSGAGRFFPAVMGPDGQTFSFDDLPPGRYEVQVYGPPQRVKEQPDAIRQDVIGRRAVNLAEGKEEKVILGPADLTRRVRP